MSSPVHQNHSINIQIEDLPALPGGASCFQVIYQAGQPTASVIQACEMYLRQANLLLASGCSITLSYQDASGNWQIVQDNNSPLPTSLMGIFSIRVFITIKIKMVANEASGEDGFRLRSIEETETVSYFQALDPRALWLHLLHKKQRPAGQLTTTPDYEQVIMSVLQADSQERPIPNDTAPVQMQLRPDDRLVLTPCVGLALKTAFGDPISLYIPLNETWGAYLQNMMTHPFAEAFRKVSERAELRLKDRWVEDKARTVGADLNGPAEVYLHPILHCAIITVMNGQVHPFMARLPADVAVEELLPDLKQQMKSALGLECPGHGELQIVPYVPPPRFADSLAEGRLGLSPRQTLMETGAQQGWAILLLVEGCTLPAIVTPVATMMALAQNVTPMANGSPHAVRLSGGGA